jgi:hypothetical protein
MPHPLHEYIAEQKEGIEIDKPDNTSKNSESSI